MLGLDEFYNGIYLDAFRTQAEPLDQWKRALRGECAYELRVVLDGTRAGIVYERYPSAGLITYLVVAPAHRNQGLGERLVRAALDDLGDRVVFGEVNDPRRTGEWARLARFQRWGAGVARIPYVQPALGDGLERDHGLVLIVFGERTSVDGAVVRGFLHELYAATEGSAPDVDAIPDRVVVEKLHGDANGDR